MSYRSMAVKLGAVKPGVVKYGAVKSGAIKLAVLLSAFFISTSAFAQFVGSPYLMTPADSSGVEDSYDIDVSGFTYAGKSKSITSDVSNPRGLAFNFDGSSFYSVGSTNDTVHQYDMSTDWDVSTAGTSQGSLDVSGEMTSPQGLDFKKEGAVLFVIHNTGNIYQYSGVAWDIGTFSYDSKTFNPTETSSGVEDIAVSYDCTKLWVLAAATMDTIFQYTMSTACDISTASYDSKSFSVLSQDTLSNGLFVSTDGTMFATVGNSNDEVFQYSMSTANDISTASYDSVSFDISSQEGTVRALFIGDGGSGTGLRAYVVGGANDTVYQYD